MMVPMITVLLSKSVHLQAQVAPPPDTPIDTPVSASGITALGYAFGAGLLPTSDGGIYPIVVHGHVVLQHDSVMAAVDSMTRAWVSALARGGAPHRIELFSSAELQVRVGHDAAAQQCIATWLATPGMSDTMRAWILGRSISLFLSSSDDAPPSPAHWSIVRQYLAQLAALPHAVSAGFLFNNYQIFMGVYMKFGMVDSALAYGLRSYALPAQTADYYTRLGMVTNLPALTSFALALSAYPDRYHKTMDSVITMLRSYAMAAPPPEFIKYPWNQLFVAASRRNLEDAIGVVQTLGRPAPTLIATQWFNQPTPPQPSDAAPSARIKPLDDGMVRIIAFGYFGCFGCEMLMKQWERFQHRLPAGVQLLFYERSSGFWGGNLVEPQEEAEHLRHYYVERKHYTYPIVVWAGEKVTNDEGGRTPKFSPTMQALGFFGGPHVIVVDGHGILRYRHDGASQTELLGVVTQLVREQRAADHHPGRTGTVSATTIGSSRAASSLSISAGTPPLTTVIPPS